MAFAILTRLTALGRASAPKPADVAATATGRLLQSAQLEPRALLTWLESGPQGLTEETIAERRESVGPNQVAHERRSHWFVQLARGFNNAFVLLLCVLAAVSYLTGDLEAAIIISVMVLVSALIRFFQEHRANLAAERLQAMVRVTTTVIRQGEGGAPAAQEVPIQDVVPGDLIRLSAGDMIPADLRLIAAKDLFITQATLTGEALPVEKVATPTAVPPRSALELLNVCFLGTNVVSGTATGVVVNTGGLTYLGSVASSIVGKRAPTSFEQGIGRVSLLLIRFMAVMTVIVFLLNGFTKHDWKEAFFFALAVAVGLTPEMLPMIVSGTLAVGAVAMSRKKVIVKQVNAIQNFGAMDVLCTDKTGTLTEDRVVLERYCDVVQDEDETVLEYAYYNSFHQTGLKNLLDKAVLAHREISIENVSKVDEIPFDFQRRIMSVVVDAGGERKLIAKGAPEEIFKRCSRVEIRGEVVDLEPLFLPDLAAELNKMSGEGFRVLAVAYRNLPLDQATFSKEHESDLVLRGYVAFLDPPKESAARAIAALARHGVRVKVLTGDNDGVARKIGREVGLEVGRVVLGHEIEALGADELAALADSVTVFARLTPAHKERVIRALQKRGHVVGFMGDGINDAPALRAADVGISVDNAVDIAKESADLILLEKDLLVLEDGVLEGRKVFGNIVKYIKMGTSSNFGNMFSMLGASAFLPFLPMLPLQLLVQNLLYDLSQLAIPFDRVDDEYLLEPRRWRVDDVARFMLFMGPVSSLFDYATFALMFFVFKANAAAHESLFQTGWFVEGLLSQTLIVHLIRTRRIPFLQSRASLPLTLTTVAVMAVGVYLPYSPVATWLHLTPLPLRFFPWLVLFLVAYAALGQLVKGWFIRRYGYN